MKHISPKLYLAFSLLFSLNTESFNNLSVATYANSSVSVKIKPKAFVPLFKSKFIFQNENGSLNKKLINEPVSSKKNLAFEQNAGQVTDQNHINRQDIKFSVSDGQINFHLKESGISYQLVKVNSYKIAENEREASAEVKHPESATIQRIDLNWIGSNKNETIGIDELDQTNNYYLNSQEYLNVKSYKGVLYKNIYNGINLHYYEYNGKLKHDWIVKPGYDYRKIKIKISVLFIISAITFFAKSTFFSSSNKYT